MGLTSNSTGNKLLKNNLDEFKEKSDYTVALAGNPNVGKSSIFNSLTGMHQHTGNWPGKTVENSFGTYTYSEKEILLVDLPGTYSIMSDSPEEEIARDFICFEKQDCTVVVVDATSLERNLNLVLQIIEITNKVVVCVNLLDEAMKKGISVNIKRLEEILGVPVVGTIATKKKTLNELKKAIYKVCNGEDTKGFELEYPDEIKEEILKLEKEIETENNKISKKWIANKLLENNENIVNKIKKEIKINEKKVKNIQETLKEKNIDKNKFQEIISIKIVKQSEKIEKEVVKKTRNIQRDRKIDKILTSKKFGIPIMLLFLGMIFWITIIGANYPSQLLSEFFGFIQEKLLEMFDNIGSPVWLKELLINGMYQTLTWVVSVMLPPMAIFFPLFTLFEDLGYLPRIAFNLDNCFKKVCSSGKQALTMCMGFGCNAAGVVGCRIIQSKRERLIAILTNAFVPCNGRFPFLITISTIFISGVGFGFKNSLISTLSVLLVVLLGIILTLIISKILSKTLLKGESSSFILELPPYRKPKLGKIIVRSIFDRTLFVLGRAIAVALPAGAVLWIFANVSIGNVTILTMIANFLEPFGRLMGLDGYILTAFILGLPANEIVLPIILMSYMQKGSLVNLEDTFKIGEILIQNGWTLLTAINVMIFTLLHFPCSTTLITIKKETNSWKWTAVAFLLPTVCGIVLCMCTNLVWNIVV